MPAEYSRPFAGLSRLALVLAWSVVLIPTRARAQTLEEHFSIGLLLHSDGEIVDVVRDSPA